MTFSRRTRRIAVISCLTVLAAGVVNAGPALAHGSGQSLPDAAQYLTAISAITPPVPGLSATVDPRGQWISVTSTSAQTLTVLGYMGEPYLRIDATGTAQNTDSPSLQLNQSLFGDITNLPFGTTGTVWQPTGTTHTVRWHDHRIHWMGAFRPPGPASHPELAALIGNWDIHLKLGTQPVELTGTLSWLPLRPVHTTPGWLLPAGGVGAGVLLSALLWLVGRYLARRRTRHLRSAEDPPGSTAPGRSSVLTPTVATTDVQPALTEAEADRHTTPALLE